MDSSTRNHLGPSAPGADWLWPRVRDIAFFAVFLIYAWAGIDSRLIYHWQGLAFSTMPGFAAEFLKYPGGPADYLNWLIVQAYAFRLAGALLLTAQAVAACALSQAYFTALAGRPIPLVRFIPPAILLCEMNLYFDRLSIVPSLLAGLALALVFVRLARRVRSQAALLAAFAAMLAAAYYLAGVGVVFFAPACAVVQIWRRPRRPWGVVYLLLAAALPVTADRLWFAYQPMATLDWFTHSEVSLVCIRWALYVLYPLATIIVLARGLIARAGLRLWRVAASRLGATAAGAKAADRPQRPGERQLAALLSITFLLLAVGGLAAGSYHLNGKNRRMLYMDYYCVHEQWADLIEQSAQLPAEDYAPAINYEVNLALHMTNRLGDEMFNFPQKGAVVLDMKNIVSPPYMRAMADMCLRLGRANDAEHFAFEALAMVPNDVRLLRLQARIQMVKAQTEAARKILTVLSYDLVEGPWARGCLRRLDQDPQLAGDEEIQLLRRRMLRTDDMPVVSRGSQIVPNVEQALKSQLEQDPANRMAFEFLMAYYLCYSDLDHARQVLGGIKNMSGQGYLRPDGKRRTPQCYQEAMAILADKTETSVNVEGFEIEPQTIQRMKHFQQVIGQSPSRDAAFEALWKTYRGSYFFYVFFGPGDYR